MIPQFPPARAVIVLAAALVWQAAAAADEPPNFGKVNGALYRGGQPRVLSLKHLQALGVKSIINLRMTNDLWGAEPVVARNFSMVYTNLPLNSLAAPTDTQVKQILTAIETLPKPVYIHCQFGADRTGMIVACYRIRRDRWPNAKALKEAEQYGLSPLETEMRQYIAHFK